MPREEDHFRDQSAAVSALRYLLPLFVVQGITVLLSSVAEHLQYVAVPILTLSFLYDLLILRMHRRRPFLHRVGMRLLLLGGQLVITLVATMTYFPLNAWLHGYWERLSGSFFPY